MNKKNKWVVYLCILIFGGIGVYFTFFAGNTSKYDSQVKAYRIEPNERESSDDSISYFPIYHYRIKGQEYECESRTGSSSAPNEKKNTVYYDSSDPTKCMTEYEKSTGKVAGIICLVVAIIVLYFGVIHKTPENTNPGEVQQEPMITPEQQQKIEENAEKAMQIVDKALLIYKRVIIGIIMLVLLVFILIDSMIFSQTLKAKDYIDTTAEYVETKEDGEDSIFVDCIYTFKDKEGNNQEIIVSVDKESYPEQTIKIKYNEKDPSDYYEEGATLDQSGMIWYVVKIVIFILLGILFFNKKLLSKIGVSISNK